MTEIITDNTTDGMKKYLQYRDSVMKNIDYDIMTEALKRVREYACKNEVIEGEAQFFLSGRTLREIENIKKERESARLEEARKAKKIQDEIAEEFKPPEESPPVNDVDGSLVEPKRIASREELQNMLYALDKNYKFVFEQINGLNDALDVIQSDMKMLKTKMQMFEDIITSVPVDNTNKDDENI
jgi:hypothetical protein